jgi:hypothetical protein
MTTDPAHPRIRRLLKRLVAAVAVVFLLAIYPVRRLAQLAADPVQPKDCPPAEPAGDGSDKPVVVVQAQPAVPWLQRGGTINDASCLNRTAVHGVVSVQDVDDIRHAHGMDHHAGSVGRSIRAMQVMLPDGSVRTVNREQEPRLFQLVVGGYGLFGVILDVDLEVTDNVVYRSERRVLD